MENNQTSSTKIKLDFKDSKYATGRRKKSVAKVWLKKGTGKFYVNGKSLDVENEKLPSKSVAPPVLEPTTITLAPGIASPLSASETDPLIVFCA